MQADNVRRSLLVDNNAPAQYAGADFQRIHFPVSQDRQVEHGCEVVPNQLQDIRANEAKDNVRHQCSKDLGRIFLGVHFAIGKTHL